MNLEQPKPDSKTSPDLINEIGYAIIRIPTFQREFDRDIGQHSDRLPDSSFHSPADRRAQGNPSLRSIKLLIPTMEPPRAKHRRKRISVRHE